MSLRFLGMELHGWFNVKIFTAAFLFVEMPVELSWAGKNLWMSSFLFFFFFF